MMRVLCAMVMFPPCFEPQIVVAEQPKQLYKFLTAICAVIGGVFTVAGGDMRTKMAWGAQAGAALVWGPPAHSLVLSS